ncbi:Ty3/gypsy retrotransposon protein [Cucumis melo var. makuwa]|uniref:Ty3/gypsy retrotransposon protein n=1 Tax=Cucumis melo var. makuwa TaxID=1194695 RepID=A0A5D3DHM2_CUCMM|nr:Ty3/gypsy retrotransposon protein [Cucumis melo var. makuwa]
MLVRFQSIQDGTLVGRFLTIKQETTVVEYRNRFDKYLAPVAFLQPVVLEETFMNGLSPWLKSEVETWEPAAQRTSSACNTSARNTSATTASEGTTRGGWPMRTITLREVATGDNRREGPTKRLTDAEFQARREKGLCFRCGEKYHTRHRCKTKENKELCTLLVKESGEELEIVEEEYFDAESEMKLSEIQNVENLNIELSINSVVGLTNPGTMKVKGKIGEEEVVILIHCGATHNFIAEKLVDKLKQPMRETPNYGVILGSGTTIKGRGVCGDVELWLGDCKVTDSFLPLELGGVDAIMGMQWLHSLGITEVDWKNLILTFYERGNKAMERRDIEGREEDGELTETKEGKIAAIISKYSEVFEWPGKLPPQRGIDHHIYLKQGTDPVNVRPYKYAHHQKEEMERALNDVTIPDKFPIPVVKELFDELNRADIFSKIEVKAGYHQIRMCPEDVEKTAFRTHKGRYEFLVMSFGLTNALLTFQALMNQVFKPYLRRFVLVFFDDVLAYSKEVEEHVQHLEVVLELLRESELDVNLDKCSFAKPRISYLELWENSSPLTQLLKTGAYKWTEEAETAFEKLKTAMMTLPVLALSDFNLPFEIESDASGFGVGAVLIQAKRPIAYFSKTLSMRDRARPMYERELIAVVLAVQRWRPYLLGRKFIVKTDQRSLKFLLEQRENKAADALSRMGPTAHLNQLTALTLLDVEVIREEVRKDLALYEIIRLIEEQGMEVPHYTIHQGVLKFKGRLVLSKTSTLIPTIMHTYHDSVFGGHSGFLRTYKRIAGELYWNGMKSDIKKYCEECMICQRNKTSALSPTGLLLPLEIPDAIWSDISMDFIEGLPKSHGWEVILVVVDRLSKYAHFLTLKHPYTAKTVPEVFVKEVVKLHDYPKSIVSDRDKIFLSHFWTEMFRLAGTKLNRSSSYHPQTDGQTKVVNKSVEAYLRCFCGEKPREWSQWLHWAEYWYNTTYHGSIGVTPFQAVYG